MFHFLGSIFLNLKKQQTVVKQAGSIKASDIFWNVINITLPAPVYHREHVFPPGTCIPQESSDTSTYCEFYQFNAADRHRITSQGEVSSH